MGALNDKPFLRIDLTALLTACGQAGNDTSAQALIAEIEPANGDAPVNTFGFREDLETGPDLFGKDVPDAQSQLVLTNSPAPGSSTADGETGVAISQPQVAYSYGYGFWLAKNRITELQQAHTALCEAMGQNCRILRFSRASSDWDGFGAVRLQVAATQAGAFDDALIEPAERLGGELVSSVRDGEDLSESIIDTEARLQSRIILRDKLTEILRNRTARQPNLLRPNRLLPT